MNESVVYQVYLRSYRDGNGDGIGDLAGLYEALGHIAELGCDAIWLSPCYPSPQRDHGYDIADYKAIDPAYGTLDDFDRMLERAHRMGLRVLMDMVANHCSSEHPWFLSAWAAEPGSPQRDRFIFRDGRGATGELPPGNWRSVFGGPAWTRITEPDGSPGQWYLHSFDAGQPDFNWRNGDVTAYFDDVLRFWFDHGVDGFRIDVAHGHVKAADLPDHPGADDGTGGHNYAMWDQPEVHDIYRSWRAIGDSYPDPKYFIGEIWVPTHDRLVKYLRPDELHQAFNFDLLVQPWSGPHLRRSIETGLRVHGRTPAWTLSNHDVHRTVTRYGQQQVFDTSSATDMIATARRTGPADLVVGQRRARAAAALLLALPGSAYLFQGEELGLPEVFDLPDDARSDPIWLRSAGRELGRDGCRVPLPWTTFGASLGFGPEGTSSPWLPQPRWFKRFAIDAQQEDSRSMLALYRSLLHARKRLFHGPRGLQWFDSGEDVIAFHSGEGACVVNTGPDPFHIPANWRLGHCVLRTTPDAGDAVVGTDAAAWYAAPEARRSASVDRD